MKHTFETKVYYADTDAYGVVWHGAYLRWLEKGRVELCDALGLDLISMKEADVLLPVTNMNVRYKSSARLNDNIIIETWLEKCNTLSVTFKQTIRNRETNRLHIEAVFDVVAINEAGKLYRKMPEDLYEKLQKGLEKCQVSV